MLSLGNFHQGCLSVKLTLTKIILHKKQKPWVKVNGKHSICEVWGLQDPNLLSLMGNVSKEATKSVPTESN